MHRARLGAIESVLTVTKRETMTFLSRYWHSLRGARAQDAVEDKALAAAVSPDPVFIETQSGPSTGRFVVMRQALLNRDMAVVGYEFARVRDPANAEREIDRDAELLRYVCGKDARNLVGDRIAFASIGHGILFDPTVDELARTKTMPLLHAAPWDGGDARQIDRILALKQAGVTVGFAGAGAVLKNTALAQAIDAVFFSITDLPPPDLLRFSRQLSKQHPLLKLGIRGLETQEEFDACCRMGFVFFHGPFIRRREEWNRIPVDPSVLRICDLLARMRRGAELIEIAEEIKRDPIISYRILRVANSAAVGATRNITSIRDATLIINREPLYRWLVLMLYATESASRGHHALAENALTRGRLMELLAESDSAESRRQVLFLTGMFSLLDVILKVPMDSLLLQMTLPQELKDALIKRSGPCAGPLQLAEACEQWDEPVVMKLCADMNIDIDTLNGALAAAGAWARESVQGLKVH